MSSLERLELHEEKPSRRGYFLLVPWMLIGIVWLRVNTGLDPGTVDFYTALLEAGAISLVLITVFEPKLVSDLARLKTSFFILMFGVTLGIVLAFFIVLSYATEGELTFNKQNGAVLANFMGLTILVVAPVETLVFQYVIPKLATMQLASFRMELAGGVLSQFTFGGFHFVAYNHSFTAMLMAVLLGIGFYALVRFSPVWGLGAAMGAHAGWNIGVTLIPLSVAQGVLFGIGGL